MSSLLVSALLPPHNHQIESQLTTTVSNVSTRGNSPKIEKRDISRELPKLLQQKDEILRDLNKGKDKLEALKKIMDQKTRDFENSQSKHSEYPSIAEFYNKAKEANAEEQERVRKTLSKIEPHYIAALNSIAALLKGAQGRATEEKETLKFEHDPVIDAKIVALQGRLAKQESVVEEQEKKQEELFKALLKAQDERQEARFAALLKAQEEEQEKQIKSLAQKQEEWRERSKALESKLAASLQESQEKVPSDEIILLKKANESLKAELSAQKRDTVEKVNELNQKVAEALENVGQIRSSVESVEREVQGHKETLKTHAYNFSLVDFDNLDGVADALGIHLPTLETASKTHKAEIEALKNELEPLKKSVNKNYTDLKDAQDSMIEFLGGQMDVLQKQGDAQEVRLKAVEGRPGQSVPSDDITKQNESLSTRLDVLERDRERNPGPAPAQAASNTADASLKSKIDEIKVELDRMRETHESRYESLKFIISSLQSQYDNISTVELAHNIANIMETLYPNTRQLTQDLDVAKSQLTEHRSKLEGVEKRMSENEVKLVELFKDLGDMIRREGLGLPYIDDSRPSKRQRVESNGHLAVENGRPHS